MIPRKLRNFSLRNLRSRHYWRNIRSGVRITIEKENFSSLIIICNSDSNSLIPAYHNNTLRKPYTVKLASNIIYYLFMPCIHDFMSDIILMNSTLCTCNALVSMRLNFRKGTLSHKIIMIKCLPLITHNSIQFNSKYRVGYPVTVLTYQNKSDKQQ